jgi:3-oxoacyl-[acyl-carrier protein] reductase
MLQFKDKVVLVTGAGKGSGRRLAEAFAMHGAKVAANDISPINVEQVVAGIIQQGGQARPFVEDIAKKVGVQALVNTVLETWGQIDILVNHANVAPVMPVLEMDEWDWHRVVDVNLTGAFLLIQSVGRVMRVQGGGVIINLIPLAGHTQTGHAAYIASKLGLLGLTRLAAEELSPYGIRVHAVGTGLTEAAQVENRAGETVATVLSLCEPSDTAQVIALQS